MPRFPLDNPSPDFETFAKVLRREEKPRRVHFAELLVDQEIMKSLVEAVIGEKWVSLNEDKKAYVRQYIRFFYRFGYDYVPLMWVFEGGGFCERFQDLCHARETNDTAILSRGRRVWADEGRGVIHSWEDFEKFPWDKITMDTEFYEFVSENLPEGMKMTFSSELFETVLEWILGYEGLFYLWHDKPDLVRAVFDRWGQKVYGFYKSIACLENMGAIFHTDDLGYKTSTMISPDSLRELVFPWLRRYASLAHQSGLMFWYHCCGNPLEIMEDLIEDVKIDAFHSFQDIIIPVAEFKKRYGKRIATLGGIDVDKLCRLEKKNLRRYIRGVLNECVPEGGYALGSGNSITNYVPVENYLVMLEEGLKFK